MGWNYLSFPKLQRLHRWSLGMYKLFHPTLYDGYNHLSMLRLKLIHVSKRGPTSQTISWTKSDLFSVLPIRTKCINFWSNKTYFPPHDAFEYACQICLHNLYSDHNVLMWQLVTMILYSMVLQLWDNLNKLPPISMYVIVQIYKLSGFYQN